MTIRAHLSVENREAPAIAVDLLSGLGNLGGRWGILHEGQHALLVKLVLLQILAGQLLAAGGFYLQRIHRAPADANFIMQVGSGGAARGSDIADDLALVDFLS